MADWQITKKSNHMLVSDPFRAVVCNAHTNGRYWWVISDIRTNENLREGYAASVKDGKEAVLNAISWLEREGYQTNPQSLAWAGVMEKE